MAQTSGFASLDGFDFHRSAASLLMVVIGGTGYLYGGMLRCHRLQGAAGALASWTPQYWTFWAALPGGAGDCRS